MFVSRILLLSFFFCLSVQAREISLEGLFFVTKQDGLEYALSGVSTGPSTSVSGPGSLSDLQGRWRAGVRASLEGFIPAPFWKSFLTYTHVGSDAHANKESSPAWALRKTWDSPHFFEDDLTRAEGNWSLEFNVVDVGVKGEVEFGCGVTVEPFFGLKGTWQKQGYHVVYEAPLNSLRMDHRQRFTGVGPMLGTSLVYHACPCIRWIGKGAVSTVVGEFQIDRTDSLTETTLPPETTTTALTSHTEITVVPVLELFAGIEVDYCRFTFRLGWEQQAWFGMNRLIKIGISPQDGGDLLTMQGLTFRAAASF